MGQEFIDAITIAAVKIMRVFPKVKGGTQIVKLISLRFKDLYTAGAKSSFVWLLGEYCKKIDDAGKILEHFTKNYFTQPVEVQLRILNSGIKMYLFEIEPIDSVMSELLQLISDKSTNPDLRDRGYIYWRLLFKDNEKSKEIIFNEQEAVHIDHSLSTEEIDKAKRMIRLGGLVSGILGKEPEDLFKGKESIVHRANVELDTENIVQHVEPEPETDIPRAKNVDLMNETTHEEKPKETPKLGNPNQKKEARNEVNLLDLDFEEPPKKAMPEPKKQAVKEENLFEEDVEEDLFEGVADDLSGQFVSMPEEVTDSNNRILLPRRRKEKQAKQVCL